MVKTKVHCACPGTCKRPECLCTIAVVTELSGAISVWISFSVVVDQKIRYN